MESGVVLDVEGINGGAMRVLFLMRQPPEGMGKRG